MNEDDDILRAFSPSPLSPMEETLNNTSENSITIFDDPTYNPSPLSPMEETLNNTSENSITIFDPNYERYNSYGTAPIDVYKARDVEQSGFKTFIAGVLDGYHNSIMGSVGRLLEARFGLGYVSFGDNPQTDEVEKGMNFWSTPDWLGISEPEWDALSIGERSALIYETTTKEIKDKYNPNELSALYIATNLAAMLGTDLPLFRLLPLSPLRATLTGGAVGGGASALHQYSTENQVTPLRTAAAIGLGVGGGKLQVNLVLLSFKLLKKILAYQMIFLIPSSRLRIQVNFLNKCVKIWEHLWTPLK
jgi:hypothetical protein